MLRLYIIIENFDMGKNKDIGLLILRLSLGAIMLLHGVAKLMGGLGPVKTMLAGKGLPEFISYFVYFGEIISPLLLIIGFRTRLASIVFMLNCLAILWLGGYSLLALGPYGGWAAELPGLFLFGSIALFFTGAGKFAVSSKNKWD